MTTASSAVSTDDEKAYGAHLPGHKGFESICTTTCPDVEEWKREHEEHGCIVTLISRDEAMAGFNEFLDAGRSTKAVAPLCHCGHTRKQHGATMQHGNDVPFDRCDYCPCPEFGLAAVAPHRITQRQAVRIARSGMRASAYNATWDHWQKFVTALAAAGIEVEQEAQK